MWFKRPKHDAKGKSHEIEFWRSWDAKMKYKNRWSSKKHGHLSNYRSSWIFSGNGMVNRLWSDGLWDIEGTNGTNIKKPCWIRKNLPKPRIFKSWHLANGNSKSSNL